MRTRYRIHAPDSAHFITSTTVEWLPIFSSSGCSDILVESLRYCRAAHKQTAYQVWQEGFHPEAIMSDEMMLQKLEYLHNNPAKAGFVTAPEHWRYSSAHSWMPGATPLVECNDWR